MIVWARPSSSQPFCAIARTDRGSVVTHCNGRWEPSDRDELVWRPSKGQGCGGCRAAMERNAKDAQTLHQVAWDIRAGRRGPDLELVAHRDVKTDNVPHDDIAARGLRSSIQARLLPLELAELREVDEAVSAVYRRGR